MLLFVRSEKVHIFRGLLSNRKTFRQIFATTISDAHVKAGNRKHFSENEDKDVKQRNFSPQIKSNIWYLIYTLHIVLQKHL